MGERFIWAEIVQDHGLFVLVLIKAILTAGSLVNSQAQFLGVQTANRGLAGPALTIGIDCHTVASTFRLALEILIVVLPCTLHLCFNIHIEGGPDVLVEIIR